MTVTEHQPENTIPKGKYTFIGVDIDTTGRRILDEVRFCAIFFNFVQKNPENFIKCLKPRAVKNIFQDPTFNNQSFKWLLSQIVHLAAYSPKDQFDQYVIPVMNLNPAARQRHQLRIITVGFFRMLKCTLTNKVVKCKTEVVALKNFLDWLEQRKTVDSESNGVVLVYNESIKFIPYMLLEALKKYDLVERFSRHVVGFVDGHALLEAKYDDTKIQTLRDIAKIPSANDDHEKNFEGNAMVRARTAYKLIEHMAKGEL